MLHAVGVLVHDLVHDLVHLIGEVAKRYEAAKGVEPKDIRAFIATAQKSWKSAAAMMKKQSAGAKKKGKAAVRKVKKAVQKRV